MTSLGLVEMFEGDSADMCTRNFLLILMAGQAEGLACADPGARTPTALAEIVILFHILFKKSFLTVSLLQFCCCSGIRNVHFVTCPIAMCATDFTKHIKLGF